MSISGFSETRLKGSTKVLWNGYNKKREACLRLAFFLIPIT